FSASMTPANAACAYAALRILERDPSLPEKLQGNDLYMLAALRERNVKMRSGGGEQIPIIPIYTYEMFKTLQVTTELYDRGVYVNSSLPPAVAPNECLIRTSLMATHTHALIDEAVDIIADVLKKYEI
ncbi:MAG: 8-amino-7-oxononanoate synthase, partial [Lachnospiraceae bacterium]|nr:8-amino-7-oxononanoate synthase [Lachnospiraceae bacterium]